MNVRACSDGDGCSCSAKGVWRPAGCIMVAVHNAKWHGGSRAQRLSRQHLRHKAAAPYLRGLGWPVCAGVTGRGYGVGTVVVRNAIPTPAGPTAGHYTITARLPTAFTYGNANEPTHRKLVTCCAWSREIQRSLHFDANSTFAKKNEPQQKCSSVHAWQPKAQHQVSAHTLARSHALRSCRQARGLSLMRSLPESDRFGKQSRAHGTHSKRQASGVAAQHHKPINRVCGGGGGGEEQY